MMTLARCRNAESEILKKMKQPMDRGKCGGRQRAPTRGFPNSPRDMQRSVYLSLLASATTRIVAHSRVRPLALLGVEFVSVLLQLERNAFQGNLSEKSPVTMITLHLRNSSLVGAWYLTTFTWMGRNDENVSALSSRLRLST